MGSETARKRDHPAFRIVAIDMNVYGPVVPRMADKLPRKPRGSGDLDVRVALRSTRFHVKHAATKAALPQKRTGAPDVNGDTAVRWRIGTDKQQFQAAARHCPRRSE